MQMYETKKIGANKMTFEEFKEQATGLLSELSKHKRVKQLYSDNAVSWSIDGGNRRTIHKSNELSFYDHIQNLKEQLKRAEDYHEINGRG